MGVSLSVSAGSSSGAGDPYEGTWTASGGTVCLVSVKQANESVYRWYGGTRDGGPYTGATQGAWTTDGLSNTNGVSDVRLYLCGGAPNDDEVQVVKRTTGSSSKEFDFQITINGTIVRDFPNTTAGSDPSPQSLGDELTGSGGTIKIVETFDTDANYIVGNSEASCSFGSFSLGTEGAVFVSSNGTTTWEFNFSGIDWDTARGDQGNPVTLVCEVTNDFDGSVEDEVRVVKRTNVTSSEEFDIDITVTDDGAAIPTKSFPNVTSNSDPAAQSLGRELSGTDGTITIVESFATSSGFTPGTASCTFGSNDVGSDPSADVQESNGTSTATWEITPVNWDGAGTSLTSDLLECSVNNDFNTEEEDRVRAVKTTDGDQDRAFDLRITVDDDDSSDVSVTFPSVSANNPPSPEGIARLFSGTGQITLEEDFEPPYVPGTASCTFGDQSDSASPSINGNTATWQMSINFDADQTDADLLECTIFNSPNDTKSDKRIKQFINRRVDNLLSHGPDRARVLRRLRESQAVSMKDAPEPLGINGGAVTGGGSLGGLGTASDGSTGALSPYGFGGSGVLDHSSEPKSDQLVAWDQWALAKDSLPQDNLPMAAGTRTQSNGMFDSIVKSGAQLLQGSGSFKFGTSLSELRAQAQQQKAEFKRKTEELAALGFGEVYRGATPNLSLTPGLDVWIEGHYSKYSDDSGDIDVDGNFGVLYLGADYVVRPGILIGALVQIDHTEEDWDEESLNEEGEIEGTGWMVGPYIGFMLRNNLYLDIRAAWGQSDNEIYLDEGGVKRTGDFDTDRWLVTATLTGNYVRGDFRITPSVSLEYGHEEFDSFKNSLGQHVEGDEASIGRVKGRVEFGYRWNIYRDGYYGGSLKDAAPAPSFVIEPQIAFSGHYDFDQETLRKCNGCEYEKDETRGAIELGLLATPADGRFAFRCAGKYDGIGSSDFESYGGSCWLNIPLHRRSTTPEPLGVTEQ